MDASFAHTAVIMLSPYFVKGGEAIAEEAGRATWEKGKELYDLIHRKLLGVRDNHAQTALVRLEEQPEAESRQIALRDILLEKADQDPAFEEELTRLVQDLSQDPGMHQFVTNVSGNAQVGKITNINRARDITIN